MDSAVGQLRSTKKLDSHINVFPLQIYLNQHQNEAILMHPLVEPKVRNNNLQKGVAIINPLSGGPWLNESNPALCETYNGWGNE